MKLYGHCFQLPHEKTHDRPKGLKQVDIETSPFLSALALSLDVPSQHSDE